MEISRNSEIEFNAGIWGEAEKLISPDPYQREKALDKFTREGFFAGSALAAYLLATLVSDEDLEVRFHAVLILGDLLDYDKSDGRVMKDPALKHVHYYFTGMEKGQMIKLLEVSERYLSAEQPIKNILRICSYAGDLLSGIVNDRKLPSPIRRLAIYFSGEIGLQDMIPVLQNLFIRIEKSRKGPGRSLSRRRTSADEALASSAVVALAKLGSGPLPGRG
jgi:hypothetical protein